MHIDWASVWTQVATPLLVVILIFGINYGLPKLPGATQHLFDWIKAHTAVIQNAGERQVLDRIITLAGQKVLALENTEIQYLKEKAASGSITAAELPALLEGVKQRALDAIKADATSQELWKDAIEIFGGSEGGVLSWLGDVVESHVAQLPKSGLTTLIQNATTPKAPVVASSVPK